ncbi:MAG: T9SS type A sorting domain-containing protein [Ignavibacteriales bacterium]|nr:T9SS type A sorting domain-containing protein [Ignavibacteriales bacterium]
MRSLLICTALALIIVLCAVVQPAKADVYPSHVRVTQATSTAAFDGSFTDGTAAAIRFILSDHADSVIVRIRSGQTVVRTIKGTDFAAGDTAVVWDGKNDAGTDVSNGTYSIQIATYDKGYNTYKEIYYFGDGIGLSTRGVTVVKNSALKNFGFIYGLDSGGYLGTTGILRLTADGRPWGNSKGVGKLDNTGMTLGSGEARYTPEADSDGYIYLISHTQRQLLRFHTDTLNVAIVDSGSFGAWYPNGIGILEGPTGKRIAMTTRNASGTAALGTDSKVLGFHLNPGSTMNTGVRDTLVSGRGVALFWDVVFGRDSTLYVTFNPPTGQLKPGVAKFDLKGKTLPLTWADTSWTVRVDSGRGNTVNYWRGAAADGSQDVVYFTIARLASGNPPQGQGIYAVTNLNAAQPTKTFAYPDQQNNLSITRSDIAIDAVGNIIYFENSNEEIAIISPPTGANSYTLNSPTTVVVGTPTDVPVTDLVPETFGLAQNYPNPFNPSTTIEYKVPVEGLVRLAVYNVLGQEVAVLVDGIVQPGHYKANFNARNAPSGAYFYVLTAGQTVLKNRMILLK